MSLLPYLLNDFPFERPRRLTDQHFGLALTPDDVLTAVVMPQLSRDYYRPWRQLAAATRDVGSSIKADKDKFQVSLDVQHFAPEEVSVKTADGYVIVEGKHEEKKDEHGYVSRQFTRRYALPEGCDAETVQSRLSSDGVLTVTAPRKQPEAIKGERAVHVQLTGPVRKEVKDQTPGQANGDHKDTPPQTFYSKLKNNSPVRGAASGGATPLVDVGDIRHMVTPSQSFYGTFPFIHKARLAQSRLRSYNCTVKTESKTEHESGLHTQ
ncbi:Protein lethal(2)essential for life [Eumeta japonica]|uniref:Protein lethal(2)essential for life n=1 Tax=Eumeta variegata TaxID=151549 RepID=A0A4C1UQ90_EUMVA|nr:Protein lethal(2)essential for life [Eumeta japonica]